MVDGVILPVCFICGKVHKEGMHGGIYIKGKFICLDCEAEICNLQAKTPDYPQMMVRLAPLSKKII